MKKYALFILVGFFVVALMTAQAQTTGEKFRLDLTAGPALPTGDFADGYGIGFHVGATFNLPLKGGFVIFGEGRYQSFALDISEWGSYPGNVTSSGGTYGAFSLVAGGKYFFPMQSKIKIYGLAGLGLFMQSVGDLTVHYTISTAWYTASVTETWSFDSQTDIGVLFGLGMNYPMSPKLSLVGELRLVVIFTEGDSTMFIPLLVGVVIHL